MTIRVKMTILFVSALLGGCASHIECGTSSSLSMENRSGIKHIGILINDSTFKVKYAPNKSMMGSTIVGGYALTMVENSIAQQKDVKTAEILFESCLSGFDIKNVLFKNLSQALEQYGYHNTQVVSSLDEAQKLKIDSVIVCEITEWGISSYPQVTPYQDAAAAYMEMKIKLFQLPAADSVWSYVLTYFHEKRDMSDLKTKEILLKELNEMNFDVSGRIINRLFNS